MGFHLNERYQCHCRFCAQILEGDSATEAILKVEEHEAECPKRNIRSVTTLVEKRPPDA